jgi:hypothetical protein
MFGRDTAMPVGQPSFETSGTGWYRRRQVALGTVVQRSHRRRLTTEDVVPTRVTSIVSSTPVLEQCSQLPTCFMLGHPIGSSARFA